MSNPLLPVEPCAVVIPALNEAGNIRQLVEEVARIVTAQVIVVDNGSSDETAQWAEAGGALVVNEPRRGYGYACAAGFSAASASGNAIVAFLDGDYSFLPAELPSLLTPILDRRADLCLGSRWLGQIDAGAMPPQQRFGNWLIARLMNRIYGLRLTDLGPYRAVRTQLLSALEMQEMTYGWPAEMLVKAARQGATMIEVPITYHRRRYGQSKVSGTLRGTILAARYILGVTLRYARPKNATGRQCKETSS